MTDTAIRCRADVAAAISANSAVVVLESTSVSHGLPRPQNLTVARELEQAVRDNGAIPAIMAWSVARSSSASTTQS